MKPINKELLHKLACKYKAGTRVVLIKMEDPQAPPTGTLGTTYGVDALGSVLVHWDNGSSLNVVYGEDEIEPL